MNNYMERNIYRIKRIIIIVIVSIVAILGLKYNKSYAAKVDINANFKDENLKNAILELLKEETKDENKTQIYESNIRNARRNIT